MIDDEHLAVGILRRDDEHDEVVENLLDVGAVLGREPVGNLGDRLCVADFGRVDRSVEEIERATLLCQLRRLGRAEPAWIGQPPIDLDQAVEAGQVFRRADGGQHVRIAHRRLPDLAEADPARGAREVLQVLDDLGIARQLTIGTNSKPEELCRRFRGLTLRAGRRGEAGEDCDQEADELATRGHQSRYFRVARAVDGGTMPLMRK